MVVFNRKCFLLAAFIAASGMAGAQSNKDSVWIQTKDGCKIYNPRPQKNESITWTGKCKNGYASGEGTLIWYKNGEANQTYTGAMERGSSHGYGKYDYKTGTVYEGNFVRGVWEGSGKLTYSDKNQIVYYTYEGVFKKGIFDDTGTEIYYSRGDTTSIYKGGFLNDMRHGHGTLKLWGVNGILVSKGTFLEGNLQDEQAEIWEYMQGVLVVYYKGGFRDGARNGYGEEVQGDNKYEGQWEADRKRGHGKLIYNGVVVYDGEWKDNQFDGLGTRLFLDGSEYKGEFDKNERHGFGVIRWKDGARYVGEFKRDLFSGKGYTIFQNNRLNAAGTWEKGALVTPEKIVPLRQFLEMKHKDLFLRLKD